MHLVKPIPHQLLSALVLMGGLTASLQSHADAIAAVQVLREGGCGGLFPPVRPLRHIASLDRAAEQWATGRTVSAAAQLSGYEAQSSSGLHIRGPASDALQLLKQAGCRTVVDPAFHDIGAFTRGLDTWVLFGAIYVAPANAKSPVLATRALQLVNEVRARGARCGQRSFAPAPPVRSSDTLADVAFGHADDMAKHDYFEHLDRTGHSPADRVRAVGYPEKLVGENIAYGPKTADEVVQGWLDSPGHCENIMDPRFAEMGIAFAAGQSSRRGLFWVQLLVAPRA
jgi:Cysteine-rich secretory protein family